MTAPDQIPRVRDVDSSGLHSEHQFRQVNFDIFLEAREDMEKVRRVV